VSTEENSTAYALSRLSRNIAGQCCGQAYHFGGPALSGVPVARAAGLLARSLSRVISCLGPKTYDP